MKVSLECRSCTSCCFLALWLFCYASLKWSFFYVMMVYYYALIWYWNDSSAFNSAKYAGKPSTTTTSSDFVSLPFVLILSFCTVVIVEVTIVCVLCEISWESQREKLWCFLQISHQRPMKFVKTCKLFLCRPIKLLFKLKLYALCFVVLAFAIVWFNEQPLTCVKFNVVY